MLDRRDEGAISLGGKFMKVISFRILLIAVSLICVSFGTADARSNNATGSSAVLGREFKIKYGQELMVKGQGLKVKFASVVDDSRCPANVTCVWEGDAKILIGVSRANARRSRLELHTNQKYTQAGKYRQYVIRLVALDPYPRTGVERKLSDYVATLLIKRR
jgi:hypothetical protein